ncbi:cell division protein FtsW [Rubricella aquisinus]|uniref:Probable peptidoglycan glycosyltransferase FtsW n=1 Tax=Rubricella aquisinus TaxID=2028108 RepID=A0A840X2I1_9RHOB|nr:putative peptidoglycan glycosyltransferase FtsW [Rubricella aquisinus]MBB5516056.1 cell division protein FtsW [Rubricella aquisinus]
MTDMVHGSVHVDPYENGEPGLARWWRSVDRWTLALVLILFLIGLLLGQAASPPLAERNGLDPFHYVTRQAFFGVLGLTVMLIISLMSPSAVRRCAIVAFIIVTIAVILLPVLGTNYGKGATRWYSLGFMSLQPSEFLKPAFVIFAAWLMSASFTRNGPPGRSLSFLVLMFLVALLAMQPDIGQASLLFASWGVMVFVAGAPWAVLIGIVGLACGGLYAAYLLFPNHIAPRIDRFLEGEVGANSQLEFATTAIREGGLFGVGLGEGSVKWRLPDAHTDYIVAVAAEEYGLVMVLVLLALFLTITLRAIWRLRLEKDPFIRIAGTGLAMLIAVQSFINIGVSARLLPEKGMTLPFVSYGGSSLLAAGITLGMLLAFTRTRRQDDLEDALYAGHVE